MKFKVGDRVSIREEYYEDYGVHDGEVLCVDVHNGKYFSEIWYQVLLNGYACRSSISEHQLTFSCGYDDFLERIKDRMS